MKNKILGLIVISLMLISPFPAYAALYEQYTEKAAVKFGHLDIVSFSDYYDEARIHEIYAELLNNFHSTELAALDAIYLYPDSPEGVAGHYYEDMRIDENGRYVFGDQSYIELFNMDAKTPADVAPVLAHEYGHHYTISNMTVYENKFYASWRDSGYGRLRSLADYPVAYAFNDENYAHRWDITEIAANDYVQLLGSPNARKSWHYKDTEQTLDEENPDVYVPTYFNMRPQENYELPLASDVGGLFQYLLAVGGYTGAMPSVEQKPRITAIVPEESFLNEKYTVYWDEAKTTGEDQRFEYTVVMYPADFPILSTGIKTVTDDEALKAVFGTVTKENADGSLSAIMDYYTGTYIFRVYAKNEKGYIFASDNFYYDFGHDFFDTTAYFEEQKNSPEEPETSDEFILAESMPADPPAKSPEKPVRANPAAAPDHPPLTPPPRASAVAPRETVHLRPQRDDNDIDYLLWKAIDDMKDKRRFRIKAVRPARQAAPVAIRKTGAALNFRRLN